MSFKTKVLNRIKRKRHRIVKKNNDAVNWGIIGTGYMAETFSNAIDGNSDGRVYAVASRSLEKAKMFSAKHGNCKAFGSYSDMINDSSIDLDVVYIATPNKEHYKNIKECLLAGKNVICEKPITTDLKELEELVDIARERKCFLMEGMWMKCLPSFQKAKSWIREGRIGNISLIKADFYKHSIIDTKYAIYDKNSGGGVLKDFGVYAVAFVSDFFDNSYEVTAFHRLSSYEIDSDWLIRIADNQKQGFINISSNFGGLSKAAVIGNEGYIEWESQFNRTNKITLFDKSGKQIDQFSAKYVFEGFEYEVNEVHKCIKNGSKESEIVPLNSSLLSMRIINMLSD